MASASWSTAAVSPFTAFVPRSWASTSSFVAALAAFVLSSIFCRTPKRSVKPRSISVDTFLSAAVAPAFSFAAVAAPACALEISSNRLESPSSCLLTASTFFWNPLNASAELSLTSIPYSTTLSAMV